MVWFGDRGDIRVREWIGRQTLASIYVLCPPSTSVLDFRKEIGVDKRVERDREFKYAEEFDRTQ